MALTLQVMTSNALPFGAPLAFALHYFGFLFLATAAAGASRRLGLGDEAAAALAVLCIGVYLLVALRRVYAGPMRFIVLKWAVVVAMILAFNHLADVVAIRLTLALL